MGKLEWKKRFDGDKYVLGYKTAMISVHRHIHHKNKDDNYTTWLLSCAGLGLSGIYLDTNDLDFAKFKAVGVVIKRIRDYSNDLDQLIRESCRLADKLVKSNAAG